MNVKKKSLILVLLFWIVFIVICLNFPNNSYNKVERETYKTIIFSYVIFGILLMHSIVIKKAYIFEPIILITAMYMAVFIFMPIHDILAHDTLQHGKYVMDGGVKATIIVTISYVFLYIFYNNKIVFNKKIKKVIDNKDKSNNNLKINNREKVVHVSLIIWGVCYSLFLLYLITYRGLNLKYILSAGLTGSFNENLITSSPLAFLGKFGNCLAVPWVYICVYDRNRLKKIVIGILTMIAYFVNGSRYIMIIFLAGPIVYYYTKKKKSPSIITISIVLFVLLISCAFIAVVRNGVRSGASIDFSSFTINDIFFPFYSNFTLYKTFYGTVQVFPSIHPYQLGRGMFLGTLILFIPRAIWPNKPEEAIKDYIEWSINFRARESGLAYNNIGEYYVEFGIIGCIFFMSLLGYICGKIKLLYESKNRNINSLILYSALYPQIFAIINAGWTPANFYTIVFTILPWFFIKSVTKRGTKND